MFKLTAILILVNVSFELVHTVTRYESKYAGWVILSYVRTDSNLSILYSMLVSRVLYLANLTNSRKIVKLNPREKLLAALQIQGKLLLVRHFFRNR